MKLLASILHQAGSGEEYESILGRACDVCVSELEVSGVAISMIAPTNVWHTIRASNGVATRLAELQFTLGVGPGNDAYSDGGPVLIADLEASETTRRWPEFAVRAITEGAGAVFAFPLQVGAIRLGILGFYRDAPGPLTPNALARALLAADLFCQSLLQVLGGRDGSDHLASSPLRLLEQVPLEQAEVHQATGMVMDQLEVSGAHALVRLRALAFTQGRLLTEVAADVVARRIVLEQD